MAFTNIIDIIYPVGAVYMSFNSTSPATLFGGTWTQVERFLLPQTTASGATGGSLTHNHSLSSDSKAISWANVDFIWSSNNWVNVGYRSVIDLSSSMKNFSATQYKAFPVSQINKADESAWHGITLGGNSQATTLLPPYVTCYAWYRTQ